MTDEDAAVIDTRNGWVGVALLYDLLPTGHNTIAGTIARTHPELAAHDDD